MLQTPDGLLVKRVRQDGASWLLVSDNPDWETFPLDTGSLVIGDTSFTLFWPIRLDYGVGIWA